MLEVKIPSDNQIRIMERVVSDSIRREKVKFSFTEEWEGYEKTAVFTHGDQTVVNVLLNSDNEMCTGEDECYVPFEVLKSPYFTVSVFGVKDGKRLTTTRGEVAVLESGYELGDGPSEPTPTEYERIITIMEQTNAVAETLREDADNGMFNGKDGEKGDKGDTGDAGVYYGTDEPTDETHPIWVNPNGEVSDEVEEIARQTAQEVCQEANELNHSVGSVYISSENVNPSAKLGGTWELIDKGFKSRSLQDISIFNPVNNVLVNNLWIMWQDHFIKIRLDVTVNTNLSDSETPIGTFNLQKLGLPIQLPLYEPNLAYSDDRNAILLYAIDVSGNLKINDVFNNTFTSGGYVTFNFQFPVKYDGMIDEFCDKFYWERTA